MYVPYRMHTASSVGLALLPISRQVKRGTEGTESGKLSESDEEGKRDWCIANLCTMCNHRAWRSCYLGAVLRMKNEQRDAGMLAL